MSLSANQLLLFDLDGTLIDSRQDLAAAVNATRAEYALSPLPVDVVASHVGDGIRKLVERSLADASVDLDEAVGRCAAHYRACMHDRTEPYPGVDAGLRALRAAGCALGMISNKPGDACRILTRHFAWEDLFACVLGGGDTPHLKPHPQPLFAAMERTGFAAADTWMIGDHRTDLQAARHAGTHSAYVTYGIGNPGPEAAERSFDRFEDLVRFFLD